MPDLPASRDRDMTLLNVAQRDRIRREGRVARALEAAQHRDGRRFARRAGERRGATPPPPSRPSP